MLRTDAYRRAGRQLNHVAADQRPALSDQEEVNPGMSRHGGLIQRDVREVFGRRVRHSARGMNVHADRVAGAGPRSPVRVPAGVSLRGT